MSAAHKIRDPRRAILDPTGRLGDADTVNVLKALRGVDQRAVDRLVRRAFSEGRQLHAKLKTLPQSTREWIVQELGL